MRKNFVFRYCTPLLAVLAVCIVATPVMAEISPWQPADFSGTDQTFTGTVISGGVLSIGPEGGFIPDPGFGFDVFIPGPNSEAMNQTGGPQLLNATPLGLANGPGGATDVTGGPMIHFDGGTWFPNEITDFHLDFLNGDTIAFSHDEIPLAVTLGAPSPGGLPAVLGIDLDLVIKGWTFWQTGPTIFTDPGAAQSEYFIPGIHRLIVDSTMVIAGGLQVIPLLVDEVIDVPIGLSGTMFSEHVGANMNLSTTLMGANNIQLPFDAALDIAGIGGSGTVTLTGAGTVLANYMLTTTVVPEPSSIVLLGFGIVGVCVAVMRRRKRLAA